MVLVPFCVTFLLIDSIDEPLTELELVGLVEVV